MKKPIACSFVLVALAFSPQVRASGGTWTMPYGGSCSATSCFSITNNGTGDAIFVESFEGEAIFATSFSGYALYGRSDQGSGGWLQALNGGTGLVALGSDGVHAYGNNIAVYASGDNTGVDSNGGVLGVRAVGGYNGVDAFGWGYGVVAAGGAAPIYLHGTIPANGQNPLCKSSGGSTAGTVGYCSSTRAMKDQIQDLDLGMDTLARLRPVMFQWRSDHTPDIGFIAEEVARVNPVLAVYNERGELQSVKYTQLTALLTKALQEQVRERHGVEEDLRKQVSNLARQNADLETRLRDQQALIGDLAARVLAVEERGGRPR
jgi:hypothetical protein